MSIKIMESNGCPGNPPKNIKKKDVRVYQILGKKCFELLRFKNSAGGISLVIPQMNNGTHISFHPREIHMKINEDCTNIDVDSFYEAHKLFTRLRSPCLCIRIGRKINEKDLNKIIPLLIKFLPDLNINETSIKNQLLKNRYFISLQTQCLSN